MKYILVIVAGLTLAQFSFTEEQANLAQRFLKIPGDTAIRVRTKNEISSETARVGDDVQMEVLADVVVNGYVVIREALLQFDRLARAREAAAMGSRGKSALTSRNGKPVPG